MHQDILKEIEAQYKDGGYHGELCTAIIDLDWKRIRKLEPNMPAKTITEYFVYTENLMAKIEEKKFADKLVAVVVTDNMKKKWLHQVTYGNRGVTMLDYRKRKVIRDELRTCGDCKALGSHYWEKYCDKHGAEIARLKDLGIW